MSKSISVEIPEDPKKRGSSVTLTGMIVRLILLVIFDIMAIWLIVNLLLDSFWPLGSILALITIFVNVIFLREGMYPLRWMVIGLSLMTLITIYPILYTVFISFTNYGDGHLLTKPQSVEAIESRTYLPETGVAFAWNAFRNADGDYLLWLRNEAGETFIARPDEPVAPSAPGDYGELNDDGVPLQIDGYDLIPRLQTIAIIEDLGAIDFGVEEEIVKVQNLDRAATTQQRYIYDPETDTMTDLATEKVFTPNLGTWTAEDGTTLPPGFWVGIGISNFTRFFSSPAIGGPLVLVSIWNFIFPLVTVVATFFLGLFTAMLFNDLPANKVIRSLLIVPYTIPSLVTILVWRGMFWEPIGVIHGFSPDWFNSPFWAKVGILIVNLWLGYPYFLLVCSGALQGIPQDIYSAADVDGANAWHKFWKLTMPLLLVAVGPLLVASYVFNFNNFNVIFLYNNGGPPIAGAATPVGHTDILISYVYKLAFGGARGADFGFASAITIIIFFVVVVVTLFQFRYTNMWGEAES